VRRSVTGWSRATPARSGSESRNRRGDHRYTSARRDRRDRRDRGPARTASDCQWHPSARAGPQTLATRSLSWQPEASSPRANSVTQHRAWTQPWSVTPSVYATLLPAGVPVTVSGPGRLGVVRLCRPPAGAAAVRRRLGESTVSGGRTPLGWGRISCPHALLTPRFIGRCSSSGLFNLINMQSGLGHQQEISEFATIAHIARPRQVKNVN
jgi:hypothetical protein